MYCPKCKHDDSRVLDSRPQKEGSMIRRRRECPVCKFRYSTVERVLVKYPHVTKANGSCEPFNPRKIMRGLELSCAKRPVSLEQIESLVEDIASQFQMRDDEMVTSQEVGEAVMGKLRNLDEVAYVRFASIYKRFQKVDEFIEAVELKDMGRLKTISSSDSENTSDTQEISPKTDIDHRL